MIDGNSSRLAKVRFYRVAIRPVTTYTAETMCMTRSDGKDEEDDSEENLRGFRWGTMRCANQEEEFMEQKGIARFNKE